MNLPENVVDSIIIGAGPTGLFAAFYGGMREMSVKVIITSGFWEAPTAISQAKHYIDPKAKVQPPHSTTVLGGA